MDGKRTDTSETTGSGSTRETRINGRRWVHHKSAQGEVDIILTEIEQARKDIRTLDKQLVVITTSGLSAIALVSAYAFLGNDLTSLLVLTVIPVIIGLCAIILVGEGLRIHELNTEIEELRQRLTEIAFEDTYENIRETDPSEGPSQLFNDGDFEYKPFPTKPFTGILSFFTTLLYIGLSGGLLYVIFSHPKRVGITGSIVGMEFGTIIGALLAAIYTLLLASMLYVTLMDIKIRKNSGKARLYQSLKDTLLNH